ncbi:protein of unknown function [Taphrina deformans PYCC 5710]|uniref:Uncharacterized protein n=1 Tax=Taphrina deformans (strain PYCC 5710 / ATCC 11124 / CBS 356.35 / IMI 108563 / JCM 9778 / NBRC 8474) TaxID=1097556 RepID=R4XFN7_TAPDE|nr:protein of unknown function [Taphrina deformans PYCC 5710]|eukprot:CCG84666.1 protein of unknown function [Taphrina deformans PYCC 5710]
MGLFDKKKKEESAAEAPRSPSPALVPPPNPFPDATPRHNPYADEATFVPQTYRPQAVSSSDPLEAAAAAKRARDESILAAIFHAFAKMLPQYGTAMKKYASLTTTDYGFNEGEYADRYPDLERLVKAHMEAKGWKVKEFSIKNGNERSKSTLNRYYPKVKWHVLEPGKAPRYLDHRVMHADPSRVVQGQKVDLHSSCRSSSSSSSSSNDNDDSHKDRLTF